MYSGKTARDEVEWVGRGIDDIRYGERVTGQWSMHEVVIQSHSSCSGCPHHVKHLSSFYHDH